MKTYSIRLTLASGLVSYLSHRGKTAWTWRTAKRHIESISLSGLLMAEIVEN